MPTLLIRNPDGTESEQELASELSIGRAEGNDIMLAEGGVSRRHARLYVANGQVFVEDTGSANGTYVDGSKIAGPTQLGSRSQVVIGDYEISLRAPGAPRGKPAGGGAPKPGGSRANGSALGADGQRATLQRPVMKPARSTRVVSDLKEKAAGSQALAKRAAGPAPAAAPAPASPPTLRGLTGPWANKLFPVRGKVTVGRVPGVQIQIDDDSVSRRHAELQATAEGIVLRDLGSANGTLVNGAPADGDVRLSAGDIVQFGVVELVMEGGPEPRSAVRKRGGAGPGGGKKPLVFVIGGVMALLLILVAVKLVGGGPKPVDQPGPQQGAGPAAASEGDLQDLLSQCRSFSSQDGISEPDWKRAEVACNKALDLEPINPEANQLVRKIAKEKEASKHFAAGQAQMQRLHEDEALDEMGKIPRDSYYYPKVKSQIQDVAESGKRRAGDDCKKYATNGFWQEAGERCARYMYFACQNMSAVDLYPPPGFVIKPNPRPKKNEWWPKDQMYQRLLTALSHDPNSKPWKCEYSPIFQTEKPPPPPEDEVRHALEARFSEKVISGAMMNYWYGKTPEAILALQHILEDVEKANLHAQSKTLKKQIFEAAGLFTEGESALQRDDTDAAAGYFDELLKLDKDLMQDETERKPSFFRHNVEADMAAKAYERGKFFMDRTEDRKGCKAWKLGFRFFKGNTDLNRATALCSNKASRALDGAQTCEDLDKVLDLAVDGDGIKDRVIERRVEMKCPAT